MRMPNLSRIIPATFVGGLFVLNFLPILAPILASLGERTVSGFIYWIYQFTCHQKASRSFFICDHQSGWCARCTFLWFSTLVSSWVSFYYRAFCAFKGLRLVTAVLLALPLIFDGGIQFIATIYALHTQSAPFYESTNSIRAITGILFGVGIGLYFFPRIREELNSSSRLSK